MYDRRHRSEHATGRAADHVGVPGKTTLTSQLPAAPAHGHGGHGHVEHDAPEHDDDLDIDALDDQARRDDDEDEDTVPRARISGVGPGDDPSDHVKTPPPHHDKPKRKRRRRRRHHGKHKDPQETKLHHAINRIYHFRELGILEAMIKSAERPASASILTDAIKGAIAATTALLEPEFAVLTNILIEGVNALARNFEKTSVPDYDFFQFCQDYLTANPKARSAAFHKAKSDMESDPGVLTAARGLAEHGTRVQTDQAAEVVTAWTNVLRNSGKDPKAAGGIGHNDGDGRPLDNAAPGRLHIDGIRINADYSVDHSHADATLKDLPGNAAYFYRHRRLESLPIARTLKFHMVRSRPIDGAFGVNANNHVVGDTKDDTSKMVFASYHTRTMLDPANQAGIDDATTIEDNWQQGIDDLWGVVKGYEIREFEKGFGKR